MGEGYHAAIANMDVVNQKMFTTKNENGHLIDLIHWAYDHI